MPVKDRTYVKIFFRADQIEKIYKMEAYDVLTFFGDLGGLLDVVLLAGSFFTSALTFRLFQADLVERAYRW